MSDKAKKFIYNYENNKCQYDNGYIVFNSGFLNNPIWFRFNNIKIDWEWSNDLIYWNKNYDNNRKCSIWINSLLDSANDINFIINYLRFKDVNNNIQLMSEQIEHISSLIDEIYTMSIVVENNKKLNNDEIKSSINKINASIKCVKDQIDKFKKDKHKKNKISKEIKKDNIELHNLDDNIVCNNKNNANNPHKSNLVTADKSILLNLNNTIGRLNNEILSYKKDIFVASDYLNNNNNTIDKNNVLYEPFLIYQSSLLAELNIKSSDSISENTKLLYQSINKLNEKIDNQISENYKLIDKLDNQIFEKNLCEKKINGNKCTIKSLDVTNKNLENKLTSYEREIRDLISEIETYKNTQEGNCLKISGITLELEQKNTTISNLINEKENMISSILQLNSNLEYDVDSNIFKVKDDYEILNSDELV